LLGYISGRIEGINYGLYTHLCHAFVTAEKDGRLEPDRRVPDRELTTRAHAAGVQVLLSLGGWGEDDVFAAIVCDFPAEDRYVDAVLSIVKTHDYDGVDLDWEYPDTNAEVAGFERLAKRLRAGLDKIAAERGKPMLLTMAVSASPRRLKWLQTKFMLETFDLIHVMTYDYAAASWSNHAEHHSAMFSSTRLGNSPSVELTMKYLLEERQFPPRRLLLGLPLFGRGFAVREPYDRNPKNSKPPHAYTPHAVLADLLQSGWTRRLDAETNTPWLITPNDSEAEVIGYDDIESLTFKTRWAKQHNLRGMFFWEILHDREAGANPLQDAVRREWVGEGPQLP
jgi:chitinase